LYRIKESDRLNFQLDQTRLINYYQFVAANGTKQIRTPKDLYKLPNEIEAINEILAEEIDQKDIDFVKSLSRKNF
jgi:hypothetical protein